MTDTSPTAEEPDYLYILKEKGLLVVPFGDIGPFAHGYTIAKPVTTSGNKRLLKAPPAQFGDHHILVDAPVAHLYPVASKWVFEVWEHIPGPGPGDFQCPFETLHEAVAAIYEYYFGDPSDMNPPELIGCI